MQETVTKDRDKYIGGSDIPAIMSISPWVSRFQLLQEKAGIKKNTFEGNEYTRYGQEMEEKIRDYFNSLTDDEDEIFYEGQHIVEHDVLDFRCHTDGENIDTILEIKTTGGNVPYDVYIVQLLFYMVCTGREKGILAVYNRPDDMSTEFDVNRLEVHHITLDQYLDKVVQIRSSVDLFLNDLLMLRDNPFLAEEDLMPKELVEATEQVIAFEQTLAELKAEEKRIKEQKQKLFEAMMKANVKHFTTINGYKIARVDGTEASEKEVEEFDEEAFMNAYKDLYKEFTVKKIITVSGRSGYVKITPPTERKKK